MKTFLTFLLLTIGLPCAGTTDTYEPRLKPFTPENHFVSDEWFNWGGSVIRAEDGSYRLFYSRFPKSIGFLSWLTHSEIAMAMSDSPSGPWHYKTTVIRGRGANHWDAITAHNPKVKRFEGRYHLYYISTTADLDDEQLRATAKGGYRHPNWGTLRNNQRAGVAVADSLDGPWRRSDAPCVLPGDPVFKITVNPAVTARPDGGYLMLIKGDKKKVGSSPRVQGIALSSKPGGPFDIQPQLAISDFDTEDASLWWDPARKRYYAVFHAHTRFGMISSEDGLKWQPAKQAVFSPKGFAAADGTTFRAERMERPAVWIDGKGTPRVFISSYRKGNQTGIFTIPLE